jgi:hypothetical protein
MKVILTEQQIKKLAEMLDNEEIKEQDVSTGDSVDAQPKSGASDDQATQPDGYPEVGKWESGVTRGPGNQIGNTKWVDSESTQPKRGKANPLK